MSNVKPSHILVDHRAWLHPNAFALMLGGRHFPMDIFSRNSFSLLYTAKHESQRHAMPVDTWHIDAQFMAGATGRQISVSEPVDIFRNLDHAQKDYVLHTVQTAHVQSLLYTTPKFADEAVRQIAVSAHETNYHETGGSNQLLPPVIMSTRQAFFPVHQIKKEKRTPEYIAQARTAYFAVNPDSYKPRYLDNDLWYETYQPMKEGGVFCPTQFVAVKERGTFFMNKVLLGDGMNQTLRKNPAQIEKGEFSLPQDVWLIMAVQPYSLKYMITALDMRTTQRILEQMEAEFINPFYRRDRRLHEVNEIMMSMPGSDPSHYSHFKEEQIAAYEKYVRPGLSLS